MEYPPPPYLTFLAFMYGNINPEEFRKEMEEWMEKERVNECTQ